MAESCLYAIGITVLTCILIFIITLLGIYIKMIMIYKSDIPKPSDQPKLPTTTATATESVKPPYTQSPAPAAPAPVKTGIVKYMGCYKDDKKRYLGYAHISEKQMTRQRCVDHCTANGFKYAGAQDGTHCFCGNPGARGFGTKLDDSKCKVSCRGNKSEKCGASYTNSILSTRLANIMS